MEYLAIIIICVLTLIIIILSIILWNLYWKYLVHVQGVSESTIPSEDIIESDHDYESIHPLSPYLDTQVDDNDGYIEDPYIPLDDLEPIYYTLEDENNAKKVFQDCGCEGACNCYYML